MPAVPADGDALELLSDCLPRRPSESDDKSFGSDDPPVSRTAVALWHFAMRHSHGADSHPRLSRFRTPLADALFGATNRYSAGDGLSKPVTHVETSQTYFAAILTAQVPDCSTSETPSEYG
jgi:hypothetical protein